MSGEQTTDPAIIDDEVLAAVSDGAYTLLVADFADTTSAWDAYEVLKKIEDTHTKIEGVLVVQRDDDGKIKIQKATDHSTRSGLKWGLVGGAALGLLFPPTIIGSAAALGAVGAAVGGGRQLHHRHELAEDLEGSIAPGHSGIVALVSDPQAVDIRNALEKAARIVDKAVNKAEAEDIKAAAKEARAEEKAAEKEEKAAEKEVKAAEKAARKAAKKAEED